eukprot:Opistho-2@59003
MIPASSRCAWRAATSLPALRLLPARAASNTTKPSAPKPSHSTKPHHFLSMADMPAQEIKALLSLAFFLKDKYRRNDVFRPLLGRTLSMIFQKRSTRTRVSAETAMAYLGGHPIFLGKDDIQLGVNESTQDTSEVLSRLSSVILARVYKHSDVEELAQYSRVPVINALSDTYHPLQALADYMTIMERFGRNSLEGLRLAWVGDGNNILNSFIVTAPKLGIHLQVATPEKYRPREDILEIGKALALQNDTTISISNDPKKAYKDARVIATDTWVSMGDEAEKEERLRAFNGFQVTMSASTHAAPDWMFLHCLPRKQEEVDDNVFYSHRSAVYDEAENRLYTMMAVLMYVLRVPPPPGFAVSH